MPNFIFIRLCEKFVRISGIKKTQKFGKELVIFIIRLIIFRIYFVSKSTNSTIPLFEQLLLFFDLFNEKIKFFLFFRENFFAGISLDVNHFTSR